MKTVLALAAVLVVTLVADRLDIDPTLGLASGTSLVVIVLVHDWLAHKTFHPTLLPLTVTLISGLGLDIARELPSGQLAQLLENAFFLLTFTCAMWLLFAALTGWRKRRPDQP